MHGKHAKSYFFLFLQTFWINYISCQDNYVRDCNAIPQGVTGAQYCSAACGAGGTATCTAADPQGLCLCNYPCGVVPSPPFSTALCTDAVASNPADPNAAAASAACNDACPSFCAGGTGAVCSIAGPVSATSPMYLGICTCYCPSSPCVTTTTPAPTLGIALLPNFLPAIKILKVKKLTIKALAIAASFLIPLGLKLLALTLLKLLLTACFLYFYPDSEPEPEFEPPMQLGWERG